MPDLFGANYSRPRLIIGQTAILAAVLVAGLLLGSGLITGEVLGQPLLQHAPIIIDGNGGFIDPASGVIGGDGTLSNPFIIEGWEINGTVDGVLENGISIFNTDAYFVIRNVEVVSSSTGIFLHNVTNGLIESVTFLDNGLGVAALGSSYLTINANSLFSNSVMAVGLFSTNQTAVTSNEIADGGGGITVITSDDVTISGNSFSTITTSGISVFQSSNVDVSNNDVLYAGSGVSLGFSSNVVVMGNSVAGGNAESPLDVGISLFFSNTTLVVGNSVADIDVGIGLFLSNTTLILENNLSSNSAGITLADSLEVEVFHNNLVDNVVQATEDPSGQNSWNATYPIGGNYWSDYAGVDNCKGPQQNDCTEPTDGLGDEPYLIPDAQGNYPGSQDNYPLMVPFGSVADTTPPLWDPDNRFFEAVDVGPTSLTLMWSPAQDDVGVVEYVIFQDGVQVGTVPSPTVPGPTISFQVAGLEPNIEYTFKVEARDAAGNQSVDGPIWVQLTPPLPPDVVVVSLEVSPTSVSAGEFVSISVVVRNDGEHPASFALTTYYDGVSIAMIQVDSLFASELRSVLFEWDTTGVPAGAYTISGIASQAEGETDTTDNARDYDQLLTVLDTTSPNWPLGSELSAGASSNTVTLSWPQATDDVAVVKYKIYQDEVFLVVVPETTTSYTVTGLSPSTTYDFRVVAYDAADNPSPSLSKTVTTEAPINNPPVLSAPADFSVSEGTAIIPFTISASDPDGQAVTVSAAGIPAGMTCTPAPPWTGTSVSMSCSWTPQEDQDGTVTVTWTADDGQGRPNSMVTDQLVITVNEVNVAPVLGAIENKSVTEQTLLTFTVTATDVDLTANTLTFSCTGCPVGAIIDPSTGVFTWTPGPEHSGKTYTVMVVASDGEARTSREFSITVNQRQQVPPAPAPFFVQYWYVIPIAVIWIVLAAVWVATHRKKKAT